VREHPMLETNDSAPEDEVLIGLINLLCTLIRVQPSFKETTSDDLIEEFFFQCLFETPTAHKHGKREPPKCKTRGTRVAAFSLLQEFARNSPAKHDKVVDLMYRTHLRDKLLKDSKWNFNPYFEQRSEAGYVGLKNLGCTCYMNSLMQQLFMLPSFRKGVLTLQPPDEDPKENYLYQLQRIFAFLQESQRRFYDPAGFTSTNKDFDGQPMNVLVQMDVDEYFNNLCEKLDTAMKGTSLQKLLYNIWGGKLSSQLICKGCPHRYERDDPYYTISLDIKNKTNIYEALHLYVKGEMLELDNAYFCEKCSTKRDTLKRNCIKTLPNTIIFNLKRFDFDFEEMKKVKLNDYFEFPMELNLESYTTVGLAKKEQAQQQQSVEQSPQMEASPNNNKMTDEQPPQQSDEEKKRIADLERAMKERPPSYYQYKLVGILVHRGTSDSGHYYSFIKVRQFS